MQNLKELIEKYKNNKQQSEVRKSERAELVKKFVDRLNAGRTGKYKPLPASFYAIKMAQAGLSLHDLYWFYGYCNDANDFSKCWWWSLKPQDQQTIQRV